MNGLAPRERRLIAIALLLALVAGVWLGVLRPLAQGFADRADQRAQALSDYARNARMLRAYPRWRAAGRALMRTSAAFEVAPGAFRGELVASAGRPGGGGAAPAQALDAARDRLTRDLAAAGASVHALRAQPAAAGTVRLRADFQIGLPGLMQVLRRVHDQAPGGLVDSLSIASQGAAAGASALESVLTSLTPMPRRFEIEPTPAVLAGVLVLGLAVQLGLPAPSPLSQVSAAGEGRSLARPTLADARIAAAPAYPAILDRPLFSPSRSGATALAGAAPAGAFALLGVASGDGRASATLSEAGGPPRSLRPGEAIDGWRLAQVGRDSAIVIRGGALQVLRVGVPARPAGPQSAAPTAPPAGSPR